MNASISSSDLIYLAFRLLKQDIYYDKRDLFLSVNVAAYEANDPFQKRQDALATIVDELHKGAHQVRNPGKRSMAGRSATTPPSFP